MSKRLIPLAAMEKLIKQVDGNIRVSDSAKAALKKELERSARIIAEKAWRLALHAGRKTVKAKDIELAVKEI